MAKKVILATEDKFLKIEKLAEIPQNWENGLRTDTSPGTFEWWYFDAHFEDGSTTVVLFYTKPITERNRKLTPGVQLTITRPDGTQVKELPPYPPYLFSASKEGCDVKCGPNWIKGDLTRLEMHLDTGVLGGDLTYTGIVPAWRPGAGKNYYSEDLRRYFGWLAVIPFGKVEGTLTYDGKAHQVKGTCYHDHNWGNIGLEQVEDHWYWGRANIGDISTTFVEQTSTKAYGYQKIPVFLLAKGNKILVTDGSPLQLTLNNFQKHSAGREFPRELDFHWQKGEDSVHISLRNPELIEAISLIFYLPKWQQSLARLFVNPYYFRFNADLLLDINLPLLKTKETGKSLYELMILK